MNSDYEAQRVLAGDLALQSNLAQSQRYANLYAWANLVGFGASALGCEFGMFGRPSQSPLGLHDELDFAVSDYLKDWDK